MKIAYLMKQEVEIPKIVPEGVEWVQLHTDERGHWNPDDLGQLADVDAFVVWSETVTPEVLAAAPNLKIVQRLGAGYDVLLPVLEAARERGIPCCNVGGGNKEAVAEHGMLMILSVARKLIEMHQHTLDTEWPRWLSPENPIFELVGKTLGIIGLGNTGSELAKRAKGFDMRIVYNDVREIDPALVSSLGVEFMKKEELLTQADVVSINTDLNDTSRGMIGGAQLALMKPTAILVCCARGGIVDELALRDSLNEGRIAGAGFDVFSPEPIRSDNPLLSAKNVVLTPHVAGVTGETMRRQYEWAHQNVRRVVVEDKQPQWIVNGL